MQYAKWKSIEIDGYLYGPEEDLKLLNVTIEPVVTLEDSYTLGYFYGDSSLEIPKKWDFEFMTADDFLVILTSMEPSSSFDEDGKIKYDFQEIIR